MPWFLTPSWALPVKLLLLGWLLYATVLAVFGALVKVAAAAAVTIAVLGVLATAVVFPILFAIIAGAVVAYAAPLVAVPRLWRTRRSRAVNVALTIGLVVACAVAGYALNAAAVRGITWIADREPCVAVRAGVTGSAPPSEKDCPSRR